jgi:hypothetical protein
MDERYELAELASQVKRWRRQRTPKLTSPMFVFLDPRAVGHFAQAPKWLIRELTLAVYLTPLVMIRDGS